MVIHLGPELEAALIESARRMGIAPDILALDTLRQRFLVPAAGAVQPRDDWERLLAGATSDCGVSLPHSALSSDELYESWPT